MSTAIATFPDFEAQVRSLVQQHRKLNKKRLRLAVYFAPLHRAKNDVFLFEIIDGFGGDAIDPEEKLFEFGYGSTPGFPLPSDSTLRMVVTNPNEFRHAIHGDWKAIQELRAARDAGQVKVIHKDVLGNRLWMLLK